MKQLFYITSLIALSAFTSQAQIAAGVVASSVVHKTNAAPDVHLQASFANNTGEISWQAVEQTTVRRYELEKSADGINFSYFTSLAGSSNHYSITDNSLFENINYYRVKIIDRDGNYMYSSIAALNTKNSLAEIKLLPTQINQKIFIWVPVNTSITKAVISDASGRTRLGNAAVNNSTNLAAIEIAPLPAGVYHIQLQTSKGETVRLKFSKQQL
jgi:hypothetical protein